MTVSIHYIGHSAFFIQDNVANAGVLIDPFISQNPTAKVNFEYESVKDIVVTHGHGDHLGDAIPLSKKLNVQITAIFELANYCAKNGATASGVNIGGLIRLNGAFAKFLPAFHSSSTPDGQYAGMPAAVLLEVDGKKIYHAGDNCLNSEMKVVGEIYKPDIALLPVGSHYTMDMYEAVVAAEWVGADTVIPIHYNTFDAISADVKKFKEEVEKIGKKCVILKPGEVLAV